MAKFDLCAEGRCKCAGTPKAPRCYKCHVGLAHPFHDDGTRNRLTDTGPELLRLGQDD